LNGRPEVVFARGTQAQGGAAVEAGGTALTVSASPRITVHFIAMRIFLKIKKQMFLYCKRRLKKCIEYTK